VEEVVAEVMVVQDQEQEEALVVIEQLHTDQLH
jgi:hypothetical protein